MHGGTVMAKPSIRTVSTALFAIMLLVSTWQSGRIYLKALLAQWLLESSWQQALDSGQPSRPWPWADAYPIAKLQLAHQASPLLVLEGDSDRVLAFGPGRMSGSAIPGGAGSMVIAGHRDTHFKGLAEQQIGDILQVQDINGGWYRYQISSTEVVDSRTTRLSLADSRPQLMLITCYPFEALTAGGPLRYVVLARLLDDPVVASVNR